MSPARTIVNLPRKRQTSTETMETNYHAHMHSLQHTRSHDHEDTHQFLVSDRLYLKSHSHPVVEEDLRDLLRAYCPQEIELHWNPDQTTEGYIRFPNRENADRAYTLFNGTNRRKNTHFHLQITPPCENREPQASAHILQIKHLSTSTTNESLYSLFRPFGPMSLCTILTDQSARCNGQALVQFFNPKDAANAEAAMNVQGSSLSVVPAVQNKPRSSPERHAQPAENISAKNDPHMVDYTNLYIKNLDLRVNSQDLFDYFSPYGRIVSARVMTNKEKKTSKGFGFVSFGKAEEAYKALQEMDGKHILNKPIIVAFHAPKKPRSDIKPPQQSSYDPSTYYPVHRPTYVVQPPVVIPPPQPTAVQTYQHYPVAQARPGPYMDPTRIYGPMTVDPVPPNYGRPCQTIYHPPQPPVQPVQPVHTVQDYPAEKEQTTMANVDIKRKHLILAVQKTGQTTEVDHIVDLLLSLKPSELSLCLFNSSYMATKVAEAKSAIAFARDRSAASGTTTDTNGSSSPLSGKSTPPLQSSQGQSTGWLTSLSTISTPSKQDDIHRGRRYNDQIDSLIASFQGLKPIEKKQKLGDQLFPCVKATGIRHAPKITIRLLDTIPLDELAYCMFDPPALKQKVDMAVLSLEQSIHST
ncbi:hypothetical protein CLU79DRAFT_752606 [Phycomyces nitens]|nr:hypothetical protein CLU79DRAFT_752606 [Phycomyces nitens]